METKNIRPEFLNQLWS